MCSVHASIVIENDIHEPLPVDVLSVGERELLHRRPARKKRDFVLGRLAAKQVAVRYVFQSCGLRIPLSALDIYEEVGGAPMLAISNKAVVENYQPPLVSISHTQGLAASLVASATSYHAVGIDIERIRIFSESTRLAFMTEREKNYCESLLPSDQPRLATIMWTLKEAYLKALGVGLRIHPGQIDVLPFIDVSLPVPYGVMGGWTEIGQTAILSRILLLR